MTDHQVARRARKSKEFFARHAERAALAGNKNEATRLLTVATRKRTVWRIAATVARIDALSARARVIAASGVVLALAACSEPPPQRLAVATGCGPANETRLYSADAATTAAQHCATVEIHTAPEGN